MNLKTLKVGTRESLLARTQTNFVVEALKHHFSTDPSNTSRAIEIVGLKTSGDAIQNRALRDVGGKALFTKELDLALLDGRIDLAVHSAKDVETKLPDGITIGGVLKRDDPRDVIISKNPIDLDNLPNGAVFGTSSLRRQSQILSINDQVKVRLLRGNVQKRLEAVACGEVDFTLLAKAGLDRLHHTPSSLRPLHLTELDANDFIPAAGQGTILIACLKDNNDNKKLLRLISDQESYDILDLERAFLTIVGGDCHTPIGLHVKKSNGATADYDLNVFVASANGCNVFKRHLSFSRHDMRSFNALAMEVHDWLITHQILEL